MSLRLSFISFVGVVFIMVVVGGNSGCSQESNVKESSTPEKESEESETKESSADDDAESESDSSDDSDLESEEDEDTSKEDGESANGSDGDSDLESDGNTTDEENTALDEDSADEDSDVESDNGTPDDDESDDAVTTGGDSDSDSDSDTDNDTEDLIPPTDGDHSKSDLTFSPTRGMYDSPLEVTITHPTATEIIYTLDASNPIDSTTSITATLPAAISIDPADTTHRYLAPGVVLRAIPLSDELAPEQVSTHTYLFPAQVVALSPDGESPGGDWPDPREGSTGYFGDADIQYIDYGMDPEVTESEAYQDQILASLLEIPSISLVTPLSHLFDDTTGIYVNALEKGDDWERPGSVELLNPDGAQDFQANCGIRIRGGYSRYGTNPKHAFRLYFRTEYGVKSLLYPLFGDEGPERFDRIDLRTSQNYSWSYFGHPLNTMNRDVFSRDLQRELGRPYTRSRYYHLYLDGVYWGLFQSQERSESRFARTYFGGDKDDYDVVKSNKIDNSNVTIEATNGTLDSWMDVWELCRDGFEDDETFYALQGLDASGDRDYNTKVHVDVDNLIDYMLVIFYTGNFDGPTSSFYSNTNPNNFYTITSRVNLEQGFVFFTHDSEHTLLQSVERMGNGLEENRVNIAEVDYGAGLMDVSGFDYFHPQWLHHLLTDNPRYCERFATRAEEVLGQGGIMTEGPASALFQAQREVLELPIIAESARWGDAQYGTGPMGIPSFPEDVTVLTKDEHWTPAVEGILTEWFPFRTDIVIEQLSDAGLYPMKK